MPVQVKLLIVLFAFITISNAAPPVPKGKVPTPVAKAKPPAKAAAVAVVRKPVPKVAYKAYAAKGKDPAPRIANSRAVYSRTPARYPRVQAGRRVPAVRQAVVYTPQVPSPERYREIQQSLADKGFFKGEVNGSWAPESVAALKDFQRSQSLDADGRLGSLSLIALGLGPRRITAAQNIPPPSTLPQPQQ